ncbi:MAG TPA: hypothetical protein VFE47_26135 [Tepidisphaeraceae bacterium]|nr:hypothetical protein [Tepidisphaeraceae bacterium]
MTSHPAPPQEMQGRSLVSRTIRPLPPHSKHAVRIASGSGYFAGDGSPGRSAGSSFPPQDSLDSSMVKLLF